MSDTTGRVTAAFAGVFVGIPVALMGAVKMSTLPDIVGVIFIAPFVFGLYGTYFLSVLWLCTKAYIDESHLQRTPEVR